MGCRKAIPKSVATQTVNREPGTLHSKPFRMGSSYWLMRPDYEVRGKDYPGNE